MNGMQLDQVIIPAISTLFGAIGASYWMRRWIDKTDIKLDDIQNDIEQIKIETAVSRRNDESTRKKIETIEQRLDKIIYNNKIS